MRIYDLLDEQVLEQHMRSGMVSMQKHSSLPLLIYNYTHKAQYAPAWGDGTIDYCRGLIENYETYEIVARPFKKFHNLNTPSIPATMEANLPLSDPVITKKYDGSLGIYYAQDACEGIATRGSFTSDQAIWATQRYATKQYDHLMRTGRLFRWPVGWTPLFEIIYSANRIVLDYDFEDLVLIGAVNIETGEEMIYQELKFLAETNSFRIAEMVDAKLFTLIDKNVENEEGYVATFAANRSDPLKVKIKMQDYVRLHRIVTGMNPHTIWELLKDGKPLPGDEGMPENFKQWLNSWAQRLNERFGLIVRDAESVYLNKPIFGVAASDFKTYRAVCAAYFKREAASRPEILPVLFAMFDGKDPSPIIWKQIEPRGDDKSFRVEGE